MVDIDVSKTLEKAYELNIGPLDLFFGIVQPLLWKIGRMFQEGQMTIQQEHQFTRFATRPLLKISDDH